MITSASIEELAELLNSLYSRAKENSTNGRPFLAAIDGPCASGKTVLSSKLKDHLETVYYLSVEVIELDHFFLPPELRCEARFAEPGGNIHYERFQQEVIKPLLAHERSVYRIFDCSIMNYAGKKTIGRCDIVLIEGVYSHHPLWRDELDHRIFCHADLDIRLQRIEKRDGQQKLRRFINEWIPMEDKYFESFDVKKMSDIMFQSGFYQLS